MSSVQNILVRRSGRFQPSEDRLCLVNIKEVEVAADQKVVSMKQTFLDIGTECGNMDKAGKNMAALVKKLYDAGIRLHDRSSLILAREYMRITHRADTQKSDKTLQTYASRLRDYLHMPPELRPDNICISAPVRDWFMKGHEIDVKFDADWWHGVVVNITRRKLRVFWVGLPPLLAFSTRSKNTEHLNPVTLDKLFSFCRPHQEGAKSGSDTTYNVEWIQANQVSIPSTFQEVVQVPDEEAQEVEEGVDDGSGDEPAGAGKLPCTSSAKGTGSGKKQKGNVSGTSSGKGSEKFGKGSLKEKNKVKRPRSEDSIPSTGSPSANVEGVIVRRKREEFKPSAFDWLSPFLGCDVIMDALKQLEQSPDLQADLMFFNHHLLLLEKLRRGQGCIYNAGGKFKNYYEAQKRELQQYQVINVEASPDRRDVFIEQIDTKFRATYTNVFTRNELAVISCVLAYPGLCFCNIDQKQLQSDGMIRGMAFVPAQLESFFHNRLRKLGLIDDKAHPKYMEPLSAVVLSSTYCYHQIVTWEEGESWVSLDEPAWKLDMFPDFLGVNGIYVRVEHTLPDVDCVLYAQVVSKITCSSLKLESWNGEVSGTQYARVIVVNKTAAKQWTARVHVWLSIGFLQADDPICLAKFNLGPPLKGKASVIKVGNPEMFSHLDDGGNPVYQPILIGKRIHPTVTFGNKVEAGVPLLYGPKVVTRRVPVEHTFRPKNLKTQAPHCDGNFFHAKGQWVRAQGGQFSLSPHVPLMTKLSMEQPDKIEAIILDGPIHLNSLSFLMGTSTDTTLTFPREGSDHGTRVPVEVEGTPFGGCSCFAFIEKHMGSEYVDPNERPHLYAHSADLRQFPTGTAAGLIAILAAKQRIENIRKERSSSKYADFATHEMRDLEDALGQFIFDLLSTSTYKVRIQEDMLNEVRKAALAQGARQ